MSLLSSCAAFFLLLFHFVSEDHQGSKIKVIVGGRETKAVFSLSITILMHLAFFFASKAVFTLMWVTVNEIITIAGSN